MKCPDCKGKKITVAVHVSYVDGSYGYGVEFPCSRCGATGEVSDKTQEWIEAGKLLRRERVEVKPYHNLVTEAARRGVDVVTLSKMERGEIEPLPVLQKQDDAHE